MNPIALPTIQLGLKAAAGPAEVGNVLQVLFLLTVLTLAPAILIMMTSFSRIIVILSFLRQALGTTSMPPNQLLVGLAMFLTFVVMGPTFRAVNDNALQPYLAGKITQSEGLDRAEKPIRAFMMKQTRPKDIELFLRISGEPAGTSIDKVPFMSLVPAFMISELKTAFQMGFIIYLPFLVLDMVVASVLMAMGMMMLPPVIISLPFKLLLFVLVDGWQLVVGSIVKSYS
ncbi:MAG: flagellar type III secretion system pore protein FliP [Bdellovibrionales bacterium]|nr:flagellar type III secretion system pore protein FliP [Bdellovibrionales bacterium]